MHKNKGVALKTTHADILLIWMRYMNAVLLHTIADYGATITFMHYEHP